MYEPNHFKAEDRGAFFAVTRVHSLVGTFKLGILNDLSADPESESQAMASLVEAHALGQSA
jgi:transcriptional regulator